MADVILSRIKAARSSQNLSLDRSLQNVPRRVAASFAEVPIQPLQEPLKLIAASIPALQLLATDQQLDMQRIGLDEPFLSVMAGNRSVNEELKPVSHCYWGTQFGNYAGQLGDGAATLIGEAEGYEINLKGGGTTPFSRGFDGRKVVRSSIREFLCSEAMAGLGIPTTRAGTVIMSEGSRVMRDVNYSGQPIWENCAVVSRIAKTFFRFGSFESEDPADSERMQQLILFTWSNLLAPLRRTETDYFMDVVIDRTARTVALWNCVGFVHGVLNTDNMSIIGDTIDYGPFGFVESFDPHFVPNTSDKFGRYALSEQARVAEWNLKRLQKNLSFHLGVNCDEHEYGYRDLSDEYISSRFRTQFNLVYRGRMREKLGLSGSNISDAEFENIMTDFWNVMDESVVDFTYTFRCLSDLRPDNIDEIREKIMSTFPSAERVVRLSSVGLRVSHDDIPEIEEFARTRLDELERVGIDLHTIERWKHKLSRIRKFTTDSQGVRSSSDQQWHAVLSRLAPLITEESRLLMKAVNPVYIPRLSLIQEAIGKVESNRDMTEVEKLLQMFQRPFENKTDLDAELYEKPALHDFGAVLSCSS